MRDYTRKAKRVDNGEWIIGCLLEIVDGTYRIATSCLEGDSENLLNVCCYEVIPETICDPTGLTDKNGNMIWENDIVKGRWWEDGKPHRLIGKVEYVYGAYKVCGVKQYDGLHDNLNGAYGIIGNVFDNKELLKV